MHWMRRMRLQGRLVLVLVCFITTLLIGRLPSHADQTGVQPEYAQQSAPPSTLTLLTQPSGFQFKLDDQLYTSKTQVLVDPGRVRVLRALPPTASRGGKTFVFNKWSNSGCAVHPIITPANSKTLIAYYRVIKGPVAKVGLYRPSQTAFLLRNANTTGPADITVTFGGSADLPVAGDWDGDGVDSVGLFRPSTGQFLLRNANTTSAQVVYQFTLGAPGDLPVAGDWDGDGRDGIGVFRPSTGRFLLRNALNAGVADLQVTFGTSGDLPVAGDWNADGIDSIGVYRPSTTNFLLANNICNCAPWANYNVTLGASGDKPLAGDWDGDGRTGIGVYRPSTGTFLLRNNPVFTGPANITLTFGSANDLPLAGNWSGSTTSPTAPEFAPNTSLLRPEGPDC